MTEWNARASNLLGSNKEVTVGKSSVLNVVIKQFEDSGSQVLAAALFGDETTNF